MRWWTTGLVMGALAAGAAGCGGPGASETAAPAPAPLAVSGDERLVVLKLPGMT